MGMVATCRYCGKEFATFPSRAAVFCTRVCSARWWGDQKAALPVDAAAERFWSKVDKNGPVHPRLGTACWLWTGSHGDHGYGHIQIGRRIEKAHRVALWLTTGTNPELMVLHHCDNGHVGCVRPEHLYEGTHLDNMRDKRERGRTNAPKGEASPNAKLSRADVRDIMKRTAAGASNTEIASVYGISRALVHAVQTGRAWGHLGLVKVPRPARLGIGHLRGAAHPAAKLTEADVVVIRGMLADGLDFRSIAERYRVSESLVRLIAKRRLWKHIA